MCKPYAKAVTQDASGALSLDKTLTLAEAKKRKLDLDTQARPVLQPSTDLESRYRQSSL